MIMMAALPPATLEAMQQVAKLLQAGELGAAQEQLQAIVERHPDYAEALRLLGGVQQALGDSTAAEAQLRRAMAADPGWAPAWLSLGELLLNSGREDEAVPLLQRVAQRLPQAALLLARHYNDRQRHADAVAITAPLCRAGRAPAELIAQHVAALAALGRQDEAVSFYSQRAAASPDDASTAHALAMAMAAAARHGEAEQAAARALSQGHRTAAVYFTHASSLIALGRFEAAEDALRDCLRQEPRHIEAHDHLARLVWLRTGDSTLAVAALDQTLQRAQGDTALLAAKAAILQGTGDPRGAYRCLATVAAQAQAGPALLVRAGLAALEFDPVTALSLAERALQRSPAASAPRHLLAAALLGIGEPRAALRHCEALLAYTPDDQYLIALQTIAWRLLGDERYEAFCDYPQLVRSQHLEVPPPWTDLPQFLADLKHSLEGLHDPQGHPLLFQSLRHGTETTGDLTRRSEPAIQALFKAFDAPLRAYLAHIGKGSDPLRRRNRGSYRYNGGWSVRLRSAGYHTNHVHPRGWISSAFYVDLPEGMADGSTAEGCLAFGQPSLLTTPALQAQYEVRPAAGKLVLFPSYFWHGTLPFRSEQARLTVAFDVVPDEAA